MRFQLSFRFFLIAITVIAIFLGVTRSVELRWFTSLPTNGIWWGFRHGDWHGLHAIGIRQDSGKWPKPQVDFYWPPGKTYPWRAEPFGFYHDGWGFWMFFQVDEEPLIDKNP